MDIKPILLARLQIIYDYFMAQTRVVPLYGQHIATPKPTPAPKAQKLSLDDFGINEDGDESGEGGGRGTARGLKQDPAKEMKSLSIA